MLIEFQVENFRSFRDRQTLSLVADAAYKEHLSTNTFDAGLRGFKPFLRSCAIYGPNAAGKTNLLRAMQFMQQFVVNSTANRNHLATGFSPYKLSSKSQKKPSQFQIAFVEDEIRYEFGFSLCAERVHTEWLIEYPGTRGRTIYQRDYNKKTKDYDWRFGASFRGERNLWSRATRPDALFLSTAVQLNSAQLLPVLNWFAKRLVVIVGPIGMNPGLTIDIFEKPNGKKRLLPFLQEADLGIVDLAVKREPVPHGGMVFGGSPEVLLHHRPGQTSPDLVTVTMSHWDEEKKEKVAFDFADESNGTRTLFRTAGAWLNVFDKGEVLLFDEIDVSLHPALVKYLIGRFHSNTNNKNNSQLIFSTHDTSLLDRNFLRRDQIWFVEKQETGASQIVPLTFFSPRNDEALEKGYLHGKYGALPLLPSIEP